MPVEPKEAPSGAPSGVAEAPVPPSEREEAAAAPSDRPAPDPTTPPGSSEPRMAGGEEPAPSSRVMGADPAARPSSEQQAAATVKPPDDEPRPGSESLALDTIRRALSALLDRLPDEPSASQAPSEQQDGLAGVKPPVAKSPSEARMAAVEPGEEAIPKAAAPSFDLVRVQRGGQMVVAGRAAPGAEVELRAGGEVIDRVRADLRGHWVSVPLRRLPAGDQELTVAARSGDALPVESEQVVVLAVPGDEPGSGRADHPAATAVALEAPGEKALAVLLPKDGGGPGRVLQAPGRIGSDGQLALLMLDYDDTGQIQLSGEASPGAKVRVYVDNELFGEALVGEDGAWTCALDRPLAPGSYTLRVDQLDAADQAVARLETPFTRVAQPPVQGDALVDYVIVQPGNSLWRIARRLLGSGFEYVHIYEANHGQIRDPDLIYPGQVFEIPIGVAGG
jgi:nucleoid-associated protein YgaU